MELRQVWTKCMPEEIRLIIERCTYDTPLDELADFADNWLRILLEDYSQTSPSTKEEVNHDSPRLFSDSIYINLMTFVLLRFYQVKFKPDLN
uniref:Uncharacterized protein n=1 Tax=Mesocestoides corti TaxID=53468 RepID=A0A5K3FWU6_MESCO